MIRILSRALLIAALVGGAIGAPGPARAAPPEEPATGHGPRATGTAPGGSATGAGWPVLEPEARSLEPDSRSATPYTLAALGRANAVDRLRRGDRPGAIAACTPALAVAGDDQLACRLLSSWALLADGRAEEALGAIAPARGHLGPLEPYGALVHGEALARTGDAAGALVALSVAQKADADGPLARRSEIPAALALARSGKLADARTRLTSLLAHRRGNAAQLLQGLADAYLAAGDERSAAAGYRGVWREHPGTAEARRATKRMRELALKGVPVPPVTAADRLSRASRLVGQGRPALAVRELDKLEAAGARGRDLAARVALLRARAIAALGRKAEAEELLRPCLAPGAPDDVVPEALFTAARLAMRRDDLATAARHLDRLVKDFPSHEDAEEAQFIAAFYHYDAGKLQDAETRFRAFLADRPGAERAEDAQWWSAWTLYKQKRWRDAEAQLARFVSERPKSKLVPQAQYWRARALDAAGQKRGAGTMLRGVASSWPASWYGLLAHSRLAADGAEVALASTSPAAATPRPLPSGARLPRPGAAATPSPGSRVAGERLERAIRLYAVGLHEPAGDELDAALQGERNPALLSAAAELAFAVGDHHRSYRLATLRLGGARVPELAYPTAYRDEVARAAASWGLDPFFVWAIMRRESGFRPQVRSPASAVGLMQLLPSTARKIGSILDLDPREAVRLDDPEVNVALGGWYLSELLGRFGGSYPLAAASYNAGPRAVAKWLGARSGMPLDEFVESIPYRETRNYVKGVMADLYVYGDTHGAPRAPLPIDLPAEARPGVEF